MRVGRAAIDEEAIRQLEQHNPDVQFDWTRILKQPAPSEYSRPPAQATSTGGSLAPYDTRATAQPELTATPADTDELRAPSKTISSSESLAALSESATESTADSSSVELAVQEADLEVEEEVEAGEELSDRPDVEVKESAALARLGAEGLARLRARHAEILARISERQLEDDVREELKARAERLNPDAWVTDEEVRQGLEQYEAVFDSLRSVLGHPRRHRRRRRRV